MAGRQKPRVLVHKAVLINDTLPATCFDINEEGMYIQSDQVFRQGEILSLDFKIGDRLVKARASVKHIQQGFGFGVKFINIPLDIKTLLRRELSPASPSDRKTVLLVDSKASSRSMYRTRLTQDGYNVVESASGSEAYSILQDIKPDIVVVDNLIDGINAYKLLQFMQTREELKGVPAIMLATNVVPEEAERVLSLGVKSFLVKATTTPKALSDRVRELLAF